MPLAGVVLNRVRAASGLLSAERAAGAAERLADVHDPTPAVQLAAAALAVHIEAAEAARHDRAMAARFTAAHPQVAQRSVPALPTDVHDLDGLRAVGAALADTAG
jgi:hypothetical protein